jgi:integral membrane protein
MHLYFRMIGWLEGTSLLTLFGIAMPLKYIWHEPLAVRIVGSIHGGLFMLYILLATVMAKREAWTKKEQVLAYILSAVPFGTFIFDHKYLTHKKSNFA